MYRLMQRIKRPRNIDPISYDQKIAFWRGLILDYSQHNRVLVVTESALKNLFKRRFISDGAILYPECLHQVLNDMLEDGLVVGASQNGMINDVLSWGYEWMVKKPVSWTWSFLSGNQ